MTSPRVSVIMAAHNAASTLPAALRSLQRQSEKRWECLLVDDHSSDDTRAVAESLASADPRVRVLASPARGVVPARNAALEVARAEVCAILDADDIAHRCRLQEQLTCFEEQGGGVVGCFPRYFAQEPAQVGPGLLRYQAWLRRQTSGDRVRASRFIEMPLAHSSMLFHREDALAIGAYRERPWPEDYDFLLRLLALELPLRVVPKVRIGWRVRQESLSRTDARYSLAAFQECRAEGLAHQVLSADRPWLLWGHGETGKTLRRALAKRGLRPRAVLEVDPRKIGQRVDGLDYLDAHAWLAQPTQEQVIVSVAGQGARNLIRQAMNEIGREEGAEFFFAA